MNTPLVSIVMGCYNDERFIKESVDSILNQTLSDFEFIIVDDASTDNTLKIIESYNDPRIKLVQNSENKGLGFNLNYGLSIAKGKYIARMDADDISMPNRLAKQVSFLENNPNVICLGTSANKIGKISLKTRIFSKKMRQVTSFSDINSILLLGTPMLHPSVMFSSELLKKTSLNYNPNYRKAQDFELWSRMISCGYEMRNLPDFLVSYRYSSNQASNLGRAEQIILSQVPYQRILKIVFGRVPSDDEINIHTKFATASQINVSDIDAIKDWLNTLLAEIRNNSSFNYSTTVKHFSLRWCALCRSSFDLAERYRMFSKIDCLSSIKGLNIIRLFI